MKRLLFIVLLLLIPTFVFAADEARTNTPLTQTTQFCVTDDANLENRIIRCDANGYPKITLGTNISSAAGDSIAVYPPNPSNSNITTNTSTQVKSASGYLFRVIVGTAEISFYSETNALLRKVRWGAASGRPIVCDYNVTTCPNGRLAVAR